MTAVKQTPGDCACRCAMAVDATLYSYAIEDKRDLAWALHQIFEDASIIALEGVESGDLDVIETASLRYGKAIAILDVVVNNSGDSMLHAAQELMGLTKSPIDAEVERLLDMKRGMVQS